jgi:hypothetical protein
MITADDRNDKIITVFAQGNTSPRAQCAKYTKSGINIFGKQVTMKEANDIIYNPFVYPELNDVGYYWSWNPLHIISKLFSLLKIYYFQSTNETVHHIHFTELNVAGREDVTQLQHAIRNSKKQHPDKNIVLFGTSRGAANALVSISTYPGDKKDVALVILEAPFDTVPSVLKYQWSFLSPVVIYLLKTFAKYDPNYITPLEAIDSFPLDIPIVFVTSEVDKIVPSYLTQNLIDKIKERCHPNVHHLSLENSGHSSMSLGNSDDQKRYVKFMHDIYDQYIC